MLIPRTDKDYEPKPFYYVSPSGDASTRKEDILASHG
jgi:hypothetical protein